MAGAMVLKTMTFGLSGFDSHLLRTAQNARRFAKGTYLFSSGTSSLGRYYFAGAQRVDLLSFLLRNKKPEVSILNGCAQSLWKANAGHIARAAAVIGKIKHENHTCTIMTKKI